MSSNSDNVPKAGNYRTRITQCENITVSDFSNPWIFFCLLNQEDLVLNQWLIRNGLLSDHRLCPKIVNGRQCGGQMHIVKCAGRPSGATLRCQTNRNHELAIRSNSFFEASKLCIQDIYMFIKCYLDGLSLKQCASFSGMSYKSKAVDWACMTRELFKEYFQRVLKNVKLNGDIEIDESLFGRRVKYHCGNPNKGLKVWVLGLVERASNTILLYHVENRTIEVLIPIIERHVEKGSTIYSDGWSAYMGLNELRYKHFTVLHKYAFKKDYKNVETGRIISVHTNRIEGAWKHAKDYFRKMAGTQATQWEGHIAKVMWRARVKSNRYEEFFDLVRTVYTLNDPPQYTYSPVNLAFNLQLIAKETKSFLVVSSSYMHHPLKTLGKSTWWNFV